MKKILLPLGILPLLLCSCNGGIQDSVTTYKITFFNVGKADAILLQYNDTNMIIDTGTKDSEEYFLEGLKRLNVDKIDCLIITHFDQDHVGGAASLISSYEIDTVYQTYEGKTSKEYARYKMALAEQNITPTTVLEDLSFTLGEVAYTIYPAYSDTYSNSESNNSSLCIRSVYKNTSYLFAGDAEKERIKELNKLNIESDFLKVPHHGGIEDNSQKFFTKVNPKYAVITDSMDEPADSKVLGLLEYVGCKVYSTKNGDITLRSDGNAIEIKQ